MSHTTDRPFVVDFSGTTAIVTGAASGIGRAIVLRLAEAGANVLGADRDIAGLQAIAEAGPVGRFHAFAVDLLDPGASQMIVDEAERVFGLGVDFLVPCAGIFETAAIEDVTDASFDRIIGINLRAPIFLVKAAKPRLRAGAAIALIASGTSIGPTGYQGIYAASKAGVAKLAASLAAELGPQGIRVNAVSPGFTDTPMIADAISDAAMTQAILGMTPDRTLGTPEHIADAVMFLLSSGAAHIHGINLPVDGGFSQVAATPALRIDE